jgi:hypothetical protein
MHNMHECNTFGQGLIIRDEKINLPKDGGYMQKMWSARRFMCMWRT